MKTIEKTLVAMLTENTGTHFLDSGGENGRMWQRNQGKDFEKEKSVTLEDGYFTVSLYHYLKETLSVDTVCKIINAYFKENDIHWSTEVDFNDIESRIGEVENIGDHFNTYNWSAPFSQDFQGIMFDFEGGHYVLLQIHNGADIRGGYTVVQCFKISTPYFAHVDVLGTVNGISVGTFYDGANLTNEDEELVEWETENVEYDLDFYITE